MVAFNWFKDFKMAVVWLFYFLDWQQHRESTVLQLLFQNEHTVREDYLNYILLQWSFATVHRESLNKKSSYNEMACQTIKYLQSLDFSELFEVYNYDLSDTNIRHNLNSLYSIKRKKQIMQEMIQN